MAASPLLVRDLRGRRRQPWRQQTLQPLSAARPTNFHFAGRKSRSEANSVGSLFQPGAFHTEFSRQWQKAPDPFERAIEPVVRPVLGANGKHFRPALLEWRLASSGPATAVLAPLAGILRGRLLVARQGALASGAENNMQASASGLRLASLGAIAAIFFSVGHRSAPAQHGDTIPYQHD